MREGHDAFRRPPGAVHDYSWVASHVALLVAAGWTLLLLGILAALVAKWGIPPASWALAALLGIWLGLVAIAFWGQRNSRRRLKAVTVDESGLRFGRTTDAESAFVPWPQIDSIESFAYPDRDALYMNKSGLRLRVGNRQFFIYEHIGGYSQLLQHVQSKIGLQ